MRVLLSAPIADLFPLFVVSRFSGSRRAATMGCCASRPASAGHSEPSVRLA